MMFLHAAARESTELPVMACAHEHVGAQERSREQSSPNRSVHLPPTYPRLNLACRENLLWDCLTQRSARVCVSLAC